MGLDMYFHAELEVSDKDDERVAEIANQMISTLPKDKGGNGWLKPSVVVRTPLAYWRKANSIHSWFVENKQDGVDNCQDSNVAPEQVTELKELCERVLSLRDEHEAGKIDQEELEGRCEAILSPAAGFFFGSTDIDEWYFEDIDYTHTRLSEILTWYDEQVKLERYWVFTYSASW